MCSLLTSVYVAEPCCLSRKSTLNLTTRCRYQAYRCLFSSPSPDLLLSRILMPITCVATEVSTRRFDEVLRIFLCVVDAAYSGRYSGSAGEVHAGLDEKTEGHIGRSCIRCQHNWIDCRCYHQGIASTFESEGATVE